MERLRQSLKSKIIVATVAVTAVTATLIGLKSYVNTRDREYAMAARTMSYEAAIYGQRISEAFDRMALDATILANLPSVTGLIRETGVSEARAGGADWARHLELTFAHFLEARPIYTQARFIARDGHWQEIVRVDQRDTGPAPVPTNALQAKGDEPYLAGADTAGLSGGYFSKVTYNREHGQVTGPPVIRYVLPVATSTGVPFGAIVLNADFERLLQTAAPGAETGQRVTVLTESLDYLVFAPGAEAAPLMFHADPEWTRPPLADLAKIHQDQPALYAQGDHIVHLHAIAVPTQSGAARVYVSTDMPRRSLLAEARRNLWQSAVLSLGVLLMAGAAIYFITTRLIAPLDRLNQAIARRRSLSEPIDFSASAQDEVSELAAGFADMANQLADEARRLTAVLDGAADGIVIVSGRGVIQQVNPAAAQIFGRSPDDLAGRPLAEILPDPLLDAQFRRGDTALREGNVLDMCERTGVRADGSDVPLEVSVARGRFAGRVHFVANIRDITRRREADQKVNALIAALERSNAELDQFTYVASHDLKAPLRVIQNATDWLAEDLEPHLTEDTRESLALLQSRTARMERLLNDLLQHSRIGRATPPSAVIPGATFTAEILAGLDMPPGARVVFSDSFADISLRRMPLQTVLSHLVGNALDHHDRPDGHVAVSLIDTPEGYDIAVTDDGPGIAKEYHERIFEIFQTLKPRDVIDTSGMGLAFVKKYISVVGGRIDVESDGRRGTTFRLWWPKDGTKELAA